MDSTKPFIKVFFLFLAFFLVVGCTRTQLPYESTSAGAEEPALETTLIISTGTSSPQATAPAVESQPQEIEVTAAPPIIIEQPTRSVESGQLYNTPTGYIAPAQIQIQKPGELSRISSPLQVLADVYPGAGGRVLVQLFGEDGRLMAEELKTLNVPNSGWVGLATSIPFDINSAGEAALLVISTRDGFGRRIAQSTVPLILLQLGESEIEFPGFQKDPYHLSVPQYGSLIKKGIVHIEGFAHAFNTNPIVGELVTETGGIMKTIVVYLPKGAVGQDYVPFSMDIPYEVSSRKAVRLTLRQADERLGGVDVALESILIYLEP